MELPPMAFDRKYLHSLHNVLVAYEHSSFGGFAYRFAATLARDTDVHVEVAHVLRPVPSCFRRILFPYAALGADEAAVEAEMLEHARADLLEAITAIDDASGGSLPSGRLAMSVSMGPVLETLRATIEGGNAELVVCGAFSGAQPTAGLLGCTAHGLLASATRPTLLVRQPGGDVRVAKVLLALDGSRVSTGMLHWATSFALLFGADVELVTVVPDVHYDDPCGLLGALRMPRDVKKAGAAKARERGARALSELVVPFPKEREVQGFSMTHHTPVAEPVTGILECIDQGEFDVVVVGTHHPESTHPGRIGHVADAVARLASCHVLMIPIALAESEEVGRGF